MHAHLCFEDGSDLIHHEAAFGAQPVARAGLDEEAKKGSVGRISRERAHGDGIGHVEAVVLENHHGTWFAYAVFATGNGPNRAALHAPSRSEIASMKS